MILPRLSIGKILAKVYEALENKTVINIFWEGYLVSIDCKNNIIYSAVEPKFMLSTLFICTEVEPNIWKFNTTVTYDQLTGKEIPMNGNLLYLKSRYQKVKDRVRHYPDFELNL